MVAQDFWKSLNPIYEPKRKLKVVCIGAGASGLLVAYRLQRHFDDFELTVFEKNEDVSGTWFENRYPGCACDVPSHCYTWSFEPKTDWSNTYASSREIYHYFKDFATKYRLDKFIKLRTQVIGAHWDEDAALWNVQVKSLSTGAITWTSCHVLINAGGVLNAWRYPPIPGLLDTYKGTVVHTASWPEKLDYTGKHVGLIGNGSSGIQVLPNVAPLAHKLTTFIREPTWVSPPVGQGHQVFSEEDRLRFARDPDYHLQFRRKIEETMNNSFALFHTDSELQQQTRQYMLQEMSRKIANPVLEKLVVPTWSVGCRRITPGPNYLESLSRDNVGVVYGEITRISEAGPVMEDGKEYPVDILVCATGFDTTFKPRFPLTGHQGANLGEQWKDEPKAYLGTAAVNFPNYFMILGPNCPVGNGPVLVAVEAQVEYIIQILSRFQKENLRSVDVKADPTDEFNQWKDQFMQHTIWTEECRSWYKAGSADGRVVALWPGSTLHYLEVLRNVRWEDWNVHYQPGTNRWAFLGNGHSSAEARGGDLSYYIRNEDDLAIDPCLKKVGEPEKGQNEPNGHA